MADAHGSGPCDSNIMRVQVPSPAYVFGKGYSHKDCILFQTKREPLEPLGSRSPLRSGPRKAEVHRTSCALPLHFFAFVDEAKVIEPV